MSSYGSFHFTSFSFHSHSISFHFIISFHFVSTSFHIRTTRTLPFWDMGSYSIMLPSFYGGAMITSGPLSIMGPGRFISRITSLEHSIPRSGIPITAYGMYLMYPYSFYLSGSLSDQQYRAYMLYPYHSLHTDDQITLIHLRMIY